MESASKTPLSGARTALFSAWPSIFSITLIGKFWQRSSLIFGETFFAASDVNAMTKTGLLGDAFFVTYMVAAPILGLLADRFSRWIIIGSAVILWSLAQRRLRSRRQLSRFSLRLAYALELAKAATDPQRPRSCPTFSQSKSRGRIMAIFCAAIPVGSALGYVIGGLIGAHLGLALGILSAVAPPGLLLGLAVFLATRPARRSGSCWQQKSPRRSCVTT